jgi:hypothetical protein
VFTPVPTFNPLDNSTGKGYFYHEYYLHNAVCGKVVSGVEVHAQQPSYVYGLVTDECIIEYDDTAVIGATLLRCFADHAVKYEYTTGKSDSSACAIENLVKSTVMTTGVCYEGAGNSQIFLCSVQPQATDVQQLPVLVDAVVDTGYDAIHGNCDSKPISSFEAYSTHDCIFVPPDSSTDDGVAPDGVLYGFRQRQRQRERQRERQRHRRSLLEKSLSKKLSLHYRTQSIDDAAAVQDNSSLPHPTMIAMDIMSNLDVVEDVV